MLVNPFWPLAPRPILRARLGFYDPNRDINPRNQRALILLGLLLECSLILFTLGQNLNLLLTVGCPSNLNTVISCAFLKSAQGFQGLQGEVKTKCRANVNHIKKARLISEQKWQPSQLFSLESLWGVELV